MVVELFLYPKRRTKIWQSAPHLGQAIFFKTANNNPLRSISLPKTIFQPNGEEKKTSNTSYIDRNLYFYTNDKVSAISFFCSLCPNHRD